MFSNEKSNFWFLTFKEVKLYSFDNSKSLSRTPVTIVLEWFPQCFDEDYKLGDSINVDHFKEGEFVDVSCHNYYFDINHP